MYFVTCNLYTSYLIIPPLSLLVSIFTAVPHRIASHRTSDPDPDTQVPLISVPSFHLLTRSPAQPSPAQSNPG
ncbi:uncharacterized protein SETTUDRAFT_162140 [Exserohilum turcica Et28A]|uniref:Uncharacterized protein n=1 Tax=Exserohilum turcicum (strain 28A) TaxID=671987 RepID=R0J384_EXST2|nr:uncharacterized protein SETTUDRAFT_162140 [Exserohilum turcica Et28A]EOA91435.1 hypothetical protein SETTUDRAFT_162140 [Exserohilum turcica Et28A]